MAFRTTLSTQYRTAKDTCTQLKKYATELKDDMAAGAVSGNTLVGLHERLVRDKATLQNAAATSGIGAYAQAQEGDGNYDVATEFNAVIAAINSVGTYLIDNDSTLSTNWLTFSASGVSIKQFSPAATATLRTRLQTLIDSIA